jgi:hypothetical protein
MSVFMWLEEVVESGKVNNVGVLDFNLLVVVKPKKKVRAVVSGESGSEDEGKKEPAGASELFGDADDISSGSDAEAAAPKKEKKVKKSPKDYENVKRGEDEPMEVIVV